MATLNLAAATKSGRATAIATAVADKQVSDLNGPPMDGGGV